MNDEARALHEFIGEAIAKGWPDNTVARTDPEFAGFYGGSYHRGPWRYLDLWAGASTDAGMMIVFQDDIPSWVCTYRGGILPGFRHLAVTTVDENELFGFLIQALRADLGAQARLRGPEVYASPDGRWRYQFSMTGTLDAFTAREVIDEDGELCYERLLIGGRVGDGVPYADGPLGGER